MTSAWREEELTPQPHLRLVRPANDPRADLRRMLVRRHLVEMYHLRQSRHIRRLLLYGMHEAREGQGWVSEDYQYGREQGGCLLREEETWVSAESRAQQGARLCQSWQR